MKKSKKYIIITNTYLALYKLCVSVLVILLLVISSQVTLSAQTNNSETEKNDTIPADKNRYIYLKKRLLLDFDILLQPRQQIYFGPILQIKSNENEYYNDSMIYMLEDDLKRFNTSDEYYSGYHWYPIKDVIKVEKFMKKHYKARVYEMVTSDELSVSLFSTLNIPKHLLILALAVGFILMMFLNYNHIENNYQDYLMYHIIGLSYREIKIKQVWKSIKMFLYTLIPCGFYELILLRGSIDHYFPIAQLILLVGIIFLVYLCVYNIPLLIVLKAHQNEEIRKEDD